MCCLDYLVPTKKKLKNLYQSVGENRNQSITLYPKRRRAAKSGALHLGVQWNSGVGSCHFRLVIFCTNKTYSLICKVLFVERVLKMYVTSVSNSIRNLSNLKSKMWKKIYILDSCNSLFKTMKIGSNQSLQNRLMVKQYTTSMLWDVVIQYSGTFYEEIIHGIVFG